MKEETLLSLIGKWSLNNPKRTALRYKRFGIWRTLSWGELQDKVDRLSRGLIELGIGKGDHLAVIGSNDPEWIISEFAIMKLGGACVGIYPDMQLEEIVYLVKASRSRIVVAEDQEQADKLIAIWDRIKGNVVAVIIWDSRGMSHYFQRYPFLVHIDEVMERGYRSKRAESAQKRIEVTADTIALILPTSGTTSLAKLAMISHGNLIRSAEIWDRRHPFNEKDEVFSLLPLPWMGEQMTIVRFLHKGIGYNFPEGQSSIDNDFLEIQPTVANMSSKMYEDICSVVRARMEDASFLKKLIYAWSLDIGLQMAERSLKKEQSYGFLKNWLYKIAMFTTLRGLRQRVGLGRIRLAFTGGAAIGREVFTFYRALGVNLMQLYGQTENCGTATSHLADDVRPETVGVPHDGIEVRIDEEGMIYVKSPTNITGYYNNSEETLNTFKEGWLKTGDSGYFDESGHLVVIDRQKDLMYLKDGTRFAPQELGNRLNFSAFIKESVVFGDKMAFVVALISIDMGNVSNWANKRNIVYTTFTDLSQNPAVIDLIREEIRGINVRLPEKMRIRRFALLPKELHPDDEELTRTRKIRRNVINERYGELVEALYRGDSTCDLDIQIKYMDGKSSRLRSKVNLEDA